MKINENMGFATKQIHAGKERNAAGALCTPIYQTSTFEFDTVEQGGARFAGEEEGYIYTRLGNPTTTVMEKTIAALEHGEAALAAASGMGAITATLWTLLSAGDEIVADETLYGCTFSLMSARLPKFGVKVRFVDMSDTANLRDALSDKTKIVYFETPCNPNLKIIDIEEVARIAHDYNSDIQVIVDNTFATPYLQKPLDLGADIVVHSVTKYLNGHGDVIAGVVIGKADFISECMMCGIKDMTGAVMSPFNAFLITRGLKTLDIRMERHCANAMKIARFLHDHPAVEKVYYPGLEDFEGYEIAKKQMKLPGAMMSIELKGGRERVGAALNKLKLATIAVSLGNCETLVEHPATMTHFPYSAEELKEAGISEGLVRINVGLEDPDDVIADFKAVFDELI